MILTTRARRAIAVVVLLAAVSAGVAVSQLPAIGAGALLYPARHVSRLEPPAGCAERTFAGLGVRLSGWHCRAGAHARNITLVYLHGIADNRDSAAGIADRFLHLGYDFVAYDSRGHGRSEGDVCSYGFFEKEDLRRVIDQAGANDVIVMGHSLGAAVALQAAPIEPKIRGVIAVSTFSDLRTVAIERAAGLYFPSFAIGWAFERTEVQGHFAVDEASPLRAASSIRAPVLLVHGAQDRNTPPAHSERVLDALRGAKRLIVVPNAGHNDVLRAEVWTEIHTWLRGVAPVELETAETARKSN